ncbi:2-amino-4-hydroxy-6-hydroxymethyldihydropteridine diphosphokinase [Fulvivirga sp. 2943]|uniref:2-amino-4-hydroxy-6-hydroxymethyldihydropteridine pyrophosphokinase n=2 Tax=Fulvivirga sediminis TaxID=2803949 RepID=A0A937JZ78_9BACT|nr:2-amino-4-hydroxy-6-hydroxymethyldihydropteridine diphosphokinase [Fulvivirga sediminis]MBL3656394.1 2-amino-4-hydroxy-6-hydroxymethyldihydropteridine diphosphokinase [Fulvivirga sediminis]
MEGIYLLLGSNLGDKKNMLDQARNLISHEIGTIINSSALYETAAWGKENQPSFYNQVLKVQSELSAESILGKIQKIESDLGRVRLEKWGSRVIDIDILYYHQEVIENENLIIPHPGIPERKFTLEPLTEIAPDYIHPILKASNQELLYKCIDSLQVKRID